MEIQSEISGHLSFPENDMAELTPPLGLGTYEKVLLTELAQEIETQKEISLLFTALQTYCRNGDIEVAPYGAAHLLVVMS